MATASVLKVLNNDSETVVEHSPTTSIGVGSASPVFHFNIKPLESESIRFPVNPLRITYKVTQVDGTTEKPYNVGTEYGVMFPLTKLSSFLIDYSFLYNGTSIVSPIATRNLELTEALNLNLSTRAFQKAHDPLTKIPMFWTSTMKEEDSKEMANLLDCDNAINKERSMYCNLTIPPFQLGGSSMNRIKNPQADKCLVLGPGTDSFFKFEIRGKSNSNSLISRSKLKRSDFHDEPAPGTSPITDNIKIEITNITIIAIHTRRIRRRNKEKKKIPKLVKIPYYVLFDTFFHVSPTSSYQKFQLNLSGDRKAKHLFLFFLKLEQFQYKSKFSFEKKAAIPEKLSSLMVGRNFEGDSHALLSLSDLDQGSKESPSKIYYIMNLQRQLQSNDLAYDTLFPTLPTENTCSGFFYMDLSEIPEMNQLVIELQFKAPTGINNLFLLALVEKEMNFLLNKRTHNVIQ